MAKQSEPSEEAKELGRRLKALRERHGLTQETVGQRVGLSADGYRQWEHGRSMGVRRRLPQTAGAYGMSIPELMIQIGWIPTADMPAGDPVAHITPAHWRRWLMASFSPAMAMAITRLIETADTYDQKDADWLAEAVQHSVDLLKDRPDRDR